jgi:ParB/RepB/Spo0J family partition protein
MGGNMKLADFEVARASTYHVDPADLDKIVLPKNWSRWEAKSDEAEDQAIEELARDIAQRGQIQDGVLRKNAQGKAELVAGKRRLLAIRRINRSPAEYGSREPVPFRVKFERLTDDEAIATNFAENRLRKELSPVDLASLARELERLKWTHERIGKLMGFGDSRVAQLLSLWELPRSVLDMVHSGTMPEALARSLRGMTEAKIEKAVAKIQAGDSAAEVKREVVAERRESGKKVGRTISEFRAELKPLAEAGVTLAVQLSEWLSGEPGAGTLAEILGEEADR